MSSRGKSKDSQLEFARTLHSIMSKQEAFNKSVESFQQFTHDTLAGLDLEIQNKQKQVNELEKLFEIEKKNRQIAIDQLLAEYKYEGALKFLTERGEVAIKQSELDKLRSQVVDLSTSHAEEIKKAVEEESKKGKIALRAALDNANLSHKAETAELNATVSQQKKEISTLEMQLENMKNEIAAQRDLTMKVAQAGAKGSVTQTFGKA